MDRKGPALGNDKYSFISDRQDIKDHLKKRTQFIIGNLSFDARLWACLRKRNVVNQAQQNTIEQEGTPEEMWAKLLLATTTIEKLSGLFTSLVEAEKPEIVWNLGYDPEDYKPSGGPGDGSTGGTPPGGGTPGGGTPEQGTPPDPGSITPKGPPEVTMEKMLDDTLSSTPVPSLDAKCKWMEDRMKIMRKESKGAEPVIVAILDSGIYEDHPDLKKEKIVLKSVNCVKGNEGDEIKDGCNHGTFCAGIYWQYSPNVEILNLKVLDKNGAGHPEITAEALKYIKLWNKAMSHKPVDIISIAFGGLVQDQTTEDLIKELAKETIIVCAAPSSGQKGKDIFPSCLPEVMAIGACDEDKHAYNHGGFDGKNPGFLFPGKNITSTSSNDKYLEMDGTSIATPHAGALVAVTLAFIEAKFPKSDRDMSRNTKLMKKLLEEECCRGADGKEGFGVPDIGRLTKPRIEAFLADHKATAP